MLVLEPIEVINRRLIERYGFHDDGNPYWRVVWSHDQFEKRLVTTTREGFALNSPYVAEVPKYRQWNDNRHILERYIVIPAEFIDDRTVLTNKSYEPVWTFQDATGTIELPPKWEVIEFVIRTIESAAATGGAKYVEDEKSLDDAEGQRYQLERLEEELFGNESPVGDALAVDSAVGYGIRKRDTKAN